MRIRHAVPILVAGTAALVAATGAASGAPDRAASQAQDRLERRALFTVMTGRKEVDAEGRRGAGDTDGRGSFSAIVDGGQLCFGMTVKNIEDPVAAHIHRGRPNQAGDVELPLTHPESGDPGASSGCTDIEAALAREILRNPHRFYVNVHTADFPAGAVRGQLFRRSR